MRAPPPPLAGSQTSTDSRYARLRSLRTAAARSTRFASGRDGSSSEAKFAAGHGARPCDLELGKPQQIADGALTLVAVASGQGWREPGPTPAPIASRSISRAGYRVRPRPPPSRRCRFRRSRCRACGRIPRRSCWWRRSDSSARLKLAIMPGFLASSRQASSREKPPDRATTRSDSRVARPRAA